MIKEKQIEHVILQWLNAQPDTFAFKVNTAGFFDTKRKVFRKNLSPFVIPGTADILFLHHGFFGAIEVKSKRGQVSLHQKAFLTKVKESGGFIAIARSLDDAIALYAEMAYYAKAIHALESQSSFPHHKSCLSKPIPSAPQNS